MQTQAGHMERQTKILEDSVAAAHASANAATAQIQMMREKERARISIADLATAPDFENPPYEVNGKKMRFMQSWIKVHNNGPTHAYNVSGRVFRTVESPNTIASMNKRCVMTVPSVIRADTLDKPIELEALQGMFEEDIAKVRDCTEDGPQVLFLLGEIIYEDVFGESHITPFNFRWEASGLIEEGQWQDTSEWIDESSSST